MGVYRSSVEDVLFVPVRVALLPTDARALQWRGALVPAPIEVRLVLDTGSRRSCLTPNILRYLQCPPGHPVSVHTSTGERGTNYYEVGMEFLSGSLAPLPRVEVAGNPL